MEADSTLMVIRTAVRAAVMIQAHLKTRTKRSIATSTHISTRSEGKRARTHWIARRPHRMKKSRRKRNRRNRRRGTRKTSTSTSTSISTSISTTLKVKRTKPLLVRRRAGAKTVCANRIKRAEDKAFQGIIRESDIWSVFLSTCDNDAGFSGQKRKNFGPGPGISKKSTSRQFRLPI